MPRWSEAPASLDFVLVLLVVPKGAAPDKQKQFNTAKRNTRNAADVLPGSEVLEVSRGISAQDLAKEIRKAVRSFFRGPGRPRKT